MSDLANDLEAACSAVKRFGPDSIDALLDTIDEKNFEGATVSSALVIDLLKACKNARGFSQILEISEIFGDLNKPDITLLNCQAQIDTGFPKVAIRKLNCLARSLDEGDNDRLLSETLGLLGRAYKQEFVIAMHSGNLDYASTSLQKSFKQHLSAYALDKAWHGANLAALAWRAEHEQIVLDFSAKAIGEKLLKDIGGTVNPNPWTVSAQAQAYMAMNDWETGRARYEDYIRRLQQVSGRSTAFEIFGDVRQLKEIWLAGRDLVTGSDGILELIEDKIARIAIPGCNSKEAREFRAALSACGDDAGRELQAMVAGSDIIPVAEMCRVVNNAATVGKISNQDGVAVGTGFLLSSRPLGFSEAPTIFITNNHVLALERKYENQVLPKDARLTFESWSEGVPNQFRVEKILWESPDNELDITVLMLEGLPNGVQVAKIGTPPDQFPTPRTPAMALDRVHPIGHPDGGALSLSMAGNRVIDHDLFLGTDGTRCLHYAANTRPGSSGGPVFARSGNLVAIHRAAKTSQFKDSLLPIEKNYLANEGVWVQCLIAQCN